MLAHLALSLAAASDPQDAPDPAFRLLRDPRERASLRDAWTRERLDTLLPRVMREHGVDLWIVVAREYDEDPVFRTLVPATWLSARRRTILVMHDAGGDAPVERLAVARYDVGDLFRRAWDPEEEPDQWKRLAALVAERDPARIAIDVSPTFALADGLASSQADELRAALPERYRERLESAEPLVIAWLETRIPAEMEVYPGLCRLAHEIIRDGLASVEAGTTTTDDLAWWYRSRVVELGLATWFHPHVSVQRTSDEPSGGDFSSDPGARAIRPGDLVHVDFGLAYLGLHTDTQHHAYVLRPGETEAPAGLRAGLALANRVQDVLMEELATGRTGNEILAATLERARAEGIDATVYAHPIGFHGHAAGPTIGLWDRQDGVPGRGDVRLRPSTCHSIELMATAPVAEWGGRSVDFMVEEDAYFDGESARFLDGRQTELTLIR